MDKRCPKCDQLNAGWLKICDCGHMFPASQSAKAPVREQTTADRGVRTQLAVAQLSSTPVQCSGSPTPDTRRSWRVHDRVEELVAPDNSNSIESLLSLGLTPRSHDGDRLTKHTNWRCSLGSPTGFRSAAWLGNMPTRNVQGLTLLIANCVLTNQLPQRLPLTCPTSLLLATPTGHQECC